MLNKLRVRVQEEKGFTLIELLVVMLILGLLAAIAVPTFFNQRDKARDADAKSQARTAETAMETYATDNQGSYTGATPALLAAIEPTIDEAALTVAIAPAAGDLYSVTSASSNTPNTFSVVRENDGDKRLTCTTAGSDGCPTGGRWD